ncbi:MAG: DUF1330 domain-containing protein [Pseudomonadota bacterium]|nr:DUF1330 domain-containing protein [Pseudomonadota bacterium]
MPAYCFFDVLEVTDPDKLAKYRQLVFATVERYGGRYLTVGGRCDVIEGKWRPAFPVLIEFPSLGQAHDWYDSDEYRDLKTLRLSATRGNAVFINGTCFEMLGRELQGPPQRSKDLRQG